MVAGSGLTKNQRRRLKKRAQKQAEANGVTMDYLKTCNGVSKPEHEPTLTSNPDVEIEYVSADPEKELTLPQDDPAYEEMMRVFGKFTSAEELCGVTDNEDRKDDDENEEAEGCKDDDQTKKETEEEQLLSKKARKKSKRLSVAELKQLVTYPDVVEAHDVTSSDPRLLVFLKSYRNTVPVPHHWCHKRKYLQGKRGVEKPPFQLPEFIAHTGIAEMRESVAEDDEKKRNKQRARERVQPKMGRVDIDYQVLHDAFFRFQTKPQLTQLGDLYYEGKEFEVKLKSKVPGQLSNELKAALGMVEGVPPPWLLNVQRYGPPPAYPNLKIPGLNAPIPEGASFGYHPGGWGKPPVDENGVPLYGDVFGKVTEAENQGQEINRERWGELNEQVEEEEQDGDIEEEEELAEGTQETMGGLDATGLDTPLVDGISSIASGLTTPGVVDLRKGLRGTETPDAPQQLYTVLEQKETSVGSSLYGSRHAYVVNGAGEESSGTRSETGRIRRRFEDAPPPESNNPVEDEDELAKKKKKAKIDKSKKLKDFKF
ncbi:splicing factor 3b subunit 2-like [Plasmopara halstedii]|uniref:Splicing factor 3b subunit 2-like n=1 Tax=Plasmopara halstedii TaxID=4781 RepID=A0A0P1AL81_PLAHL|nr:splicing factor 3b subunit 2-like [Plasmopara halstedii]CEG41434.1 splicing factor 3b subunit 2-like [Plasmopara halstedii]|eukprot:XP_024577803.1 splicing factor 3b subunit 2-like [Plasmopara halstedii]